MDGRLTSRAILGDCMDVMREYPDKYFDLAVDANVWRLQIRTRRVERGWDMLRLP